MCTTQQRPGPCHSWVDPLFKASHSALPPAGIGAGCARDIHCWGACGDHCFICSTAACDHKQAAPPQADHPRQRWRRVHVLAQGRPTQMRLSQTCWYQAGCTSLHRLMQNKTTQMLLGSKRIHALAQGDTAKVIFVGACSLGAALCVLVMAQCSVQ